MSNAIFPELRGLSWNVTKTPEFYTLTKTSPTGLDVSAVMSAYPRWQFSLSYEFLRDEEDDEQNLLVIAEDCPEGVNSPTVYTTQAADRPSLNAAADPGDANPPILFNAPAGLTGGTLVVYLAASGKSIDWGGCGVWVSQDGSTYQRIGSVTAPATMGRLTADLPVPPEIPAVPDPPPETESVEGGTQNPDLTNILSVDLSESRGQIYNVAKEAADTYATLSYVGGELISYKEAELTDKSCYEVSYLVRGIYGTPITVHNEGAPFVKLNEAVFKYNYAEVNVGQTIYIKLTSFNFFGKSEQPLESVKRYSHIL